MIKVVSLSDRYQPALDGLRAIAIVWILFHNGQYIFKESLADDALLMKLISFFLGAGWLGVQLFFVLSGFLITGILVDAKKRQGKSQAGRILKQFYMRRVLRIFPAYYAFLFVVFAYVFMVNDAPAWLKQAYDLKKWFLLYVSNWVQPFESVGLAHIWSLAVEEQFYLVWPLVVLFFTGNRLVWVCCAVVFAAIFFRVIVGYSAIDFNASPAYIFTLARADALVCGALLALWLRNDQWHAVLCRYAWPLMAVCCGYILLVVLLVRDFPSANTGWLVLNQTIAAILFVGVVYKALNLSQHSTGHQRFYIKVLSNPVLRTIGKYSYAMYIIHWPLSRVLKHSVFGEWVLSTGSGSLKLAVAGILVSEMVLFLLTFAMAWVSWRMIEQPFLLLKKRWPMAFNS